MKKELIAELFEKFEAARQVAEGVEFWSAKDLQHILGYHDWKPFAKVIEKAQNSCQITGEKIEDHFIDMATLSGQDSSDKALTRFGCYLAAQNGDPLKNEVAFAQTYFAVQARKQEIIEKRLLDVARVSARERLSKSERKLSGLIYERGVDEKGFASIRSQGDRALFGHSTSEMKKILKVPENRPLADFLPTLTIKAKDFATELTSHNVQEKDLIGLEEIIKEHNDNNLAVRQMLKERGVEPEKLPAAEDVQLVKRRLESEEKKILSEAKKQKKNK
jgi:DNA-damage-inducible protein D